MPVNGFHTTELRVQVLTLWAVQYKTEQIANILDLPPRTVLNIIKKGKDRGYRPSENFRVKLSYVEDEKRPGRPVKASKAIQNSEIAPVSADHAG